MRTFTYAIGALLLSAAVLTAQERDIFNYAAQAKAGKDVKKIVFIAADEGHGGKGNHEFKAGAIFMARTLNATYQDVHAVVHKNTKWPKDVSHADCIIVLLNHGAKAATDASIQAVVDKGAGFMAIHYGVEVNKGPQGEKYLKWIGGHFETFWSVNPFWTAKFDKIPEHATTRGVKPFEVNDEWYYHMRFAPEMKGVTPILSANPAVETISKRWDGKKPGSHNGNEAALEAVKAGRPQHVAWAFEREGGGRGFGFTGYHNYNNLTNDSFCTLLLNAAAWTAKLEVPANGIQTKTPTKDDLEGWFQEGLRVP